MKGLILVIFLTVAAQQATGQANRSTLLDGAAAEQNFQYLKKLTSETGTVQVYDNRYKGVRGTPFFLDNWGSASLQVGQKEFQNIVAKYNVLDEEIWYLDKKGNAFIIPSTQLTSFILTDSLGLRTYVFKKLPAVEKIAPELKNNLFVLLHDGTKTQMVLAPKKKIAES